MAGGLLKGSNAAAAALQTGPGDAARWRAELTTSPEFSHPVWIWRSHHFEMST